MKTDELTWKDVRRIVISADELCAAWGKDKMKEEGQQKFYETILQVFLDMKNS